MTQETEIVTVTTQSEATVEVKVEHGGTLKRTLHEVALYPRHAPRTPTALYRRNHHRMVVVEDRPCLVCGVRNSDLADKDRRCDPHINPWGAKQMETHHRLIEEGFALAVSVEKFNGRTRLGLLKKTSDWHKYGHPFTREEMIAWIRGDEDNLWVICDVHHRGEYVGIHSITGPIWGMQDLLVDGYDLTGMVARSAEEAADLESLPTTTGKPKAPRMKRRSQH